MYEYNQDPPEYGYHQQYEIYNQELPRQRQLINEILKKKLNITVSYERDTDPETLKQIKLTLQKVKTILEETNLPIKITIHE